MVDRVVLPDGVELAYEVVGHGRPVYVCHGGPSTDFEYLGVDLAPLVQGHAILFHHYRGSGESGVAAPSSYTFDQLADDLEFLRRRRGDDRVVVVGHSMGADIALRHALRHPAGVAGVVLVGGAPGISVLETLGPMSPRAISRAAGRGLVYLLRWSWRPESDPRQLARYALWRATFEAKPEVQRQLEARGSWRRNDNARSLERAGFDRSIWSQVADLKVPLLLLYGSRDAGAVAAARRFRSAVPGAEELVIAGAGHHPFYESGAALEALADFTLRAQATRTNGEPTC